MSHIVISYASEDRRFVERLADALTESGHGVWFDRELETGAFRNQIELQIDRADVVVGIWSARSIASRYVIGECERAIGRNVLLPVRIDETSLPLGFTTEQTFDLSDWDGRLIDGRFQKVVQEIDKKSDGITSPKGRPRPRIFLVTASLILAIGVVGGLVLSLLAGLVTEQGCSFLFLQGLPCQLTTGFIAAIACATPVVVWGAIEVASFGQSSRKLIAARVSRIYFVAAMVGLAFAAVASTASYGRLGFYFVTSTLVIAAVIALSALLLLVARKLVG